MSRQFVEAGTRPSLVKVMDFFNDRQSQRGLAETASDMGRWLLADALREWMPLATQKMAPGDKGILTAMVMAAYEMGRDAGKEE